MKKSIVVSMVLVITCQIYAQDKIEYLTGKITECEVTEVTDTNIKFRPVGETLINSALTENVKAIEFSSGETQRINDDIVIKSELEWEKVKILFEDADLGVLSKGQDFSVKVTKRGVFSLNKEKTKQDAFNRLRKEAAKLGYPFVLVQKMESDEMKYSKRRHYTFSLEAVGYKHTF